jgi:hypothetical protein
MQTCQRAGDLIGVTGARNLRSQTALVMKEAIAQAVPANLKTRRSQFANRTHHLALTSLNNQDDGAHVNENDIFGYAYRGHK